MRFIAFCLITSSAFASNALAAEKSFPGIQKLMTHEEYQASGLAKLNEEERRALDRWLLRYTVQDAPELVRVNEETREAKAELRIESRIQQPFSGWDGKTLFKLANGQLWRQRLPGRYSHQSDDTRVVIDKNIMGFYRMTMEAGGKTIGVSRVE